MGRPWAELSSPERLDAILLAVHRLDEARWASATGNAIAAAVDSEHWMKRPRGGNHGTGNVLRAMSLATRVTPGITALRKRELLTFGSRSDGLSGTCDHLTTAGQARVRELLQRGSAA